MTDPTRTEIRVLVVDDHPLILQGIRAQLAGCEHIQVVATTERGEEAADLAERHAADVALMDISLAGLNGIEATRALLRRRPRTAVVILTMHDDDNYVVQAAQAGARGYILKSARPEVLVEAIEAVSRGQTAFALDAAGARVRELAGRGPASAKQRLTPRERQVLALIARGRINKEIAEELSVGVRTVETYRERLMRKLELRTVAELTRYAIAVGLITLE